MKQRWCWASQVAEPQVNVWTHCCNCGCDRRLVSGPVRLQVHIRPLAHSGAFCAGAAQRPHALSAVCLGHVLWTGTGASAGPRARGCAGPLPASPDSPHALACWPHSQRHSSSPSGVWIIGQGFLGTCHLLSQLGVQPGVRQVFAAFDASRWVEKAPFSGICDPCYRSV